MYNTKSEPNYGFWVIMMHECQFILGKKGTILVSDLYNGGGYMFVGSVGI